MMSHAITRAKERLGVDFDGYDLKAIAGLIDRGDALLLQTCPIRGTQAYLVKYRDMVFKAVYAPLGNAIISFYAKGQALPRSRYNKRKNGKRKRGKAPRKNRKLTDYAGYVK